MSSNDALLDVQQLDTEAGQLRHRRTNLEQRAKLSDGLAEQARHNERIETIGVERVEIVSRQKRFEDEAATVQAKADADDNRLYSGEVQGIKDLQMLQDEISGLRSRQGNLEEKALEVMFEAEDLATQVAVLERDRSGVDELVTVLEAEIAAAEAEIDSRLAAVDAQRAEAAGGVDDDLLERYERLRKDFGSATAVRFDDAAGCVGCPSVMPAVEADRVKHCERGSVVDCQECGRIVFR